MRIRLHQALRSIGLPLALGVCGGVVAPTAAVSTVRADHPREGHFGSESCVRLCRTLGIGWGDGYHNCHPRREGRAADLPPATDYASPYAASVDPFQDAQQIRLPWLLRPRPLPKPDAAGTKLAPPSFRAQPVSLPRSQ